jgi:hypothetical protein
LRPDPRAHHFKLIGVAGMIAASGWAASVSASPAVFVAMPDLVLASRLQVEEGVTDAPDLEEAGPVEPPPSPRDLDGLELEPSALRRCASPPLPPLLLAPKNGPPLLGQA